MKPLELDPRGIYFQDKRMCYECGKLIKMKEDYKVVILETGLRLYLCEDEDR